LIYKILAVIVVAGLAAPALARQDPPPPPSGIVIHLFGPDSIASKILPAVPVANAPAASVASGTAMAPRPAAAPAYQEPSLHDVLHQMFVTGDPDQKTGQDLAPGRTAERY